MLKVIRVSKGHTNACMHVIVVFLYEKMRRWMGIC